MKGFSDKGCTEDDAPEARGLLSGGHDRQRAGKGFTQNKEIGPFREKMRTIDILRFLTDAELDDLLGRAEVLSFAVGETIIRQGDVSEHLFAVVDGAVDVSVREFSREEVFITRLETGDVFGEAAVFVREQRTATVTASRQTTLLRVDRRSLLAFFQKNPHAGNKVLMVVIFSLVEKLKRANRELAFEKQGEVDFDMVDDLVQDFMEQI